MFEHQRAIKYQRPDKSALCQHSTSLDHAINWFKHCIVGKILLDLYTGHTVPEEQTAQNWSKVEVLKTETD